MQGSVTGRLRLVSSKLGAAMGLSSARRLAVAEDRDRVDSFVRQLRRYEAKYWISPALVPQVRAAVTEFCRPDKHAHGDPPGYRIWTMQLDTAKLSLYHARARDALHRFKLRIRRYACEPSAQVILEIKRKLGGTVVKSRCRIAAGHLDPLRVLSPQVRPLVDSPDEAEALQEFRRLMRDTGCRPVLTIRYFREAWTSVRDTYARVTFDGGLCYRPVHNAIDWRQDAVRWRPCAHVSPELRPDGVILELKATEQVPIWMQDLVRRFDLNRRAVCKYALAIEAERRFLPQRGIAEW